MARDFLGLNWKGSTKMVEEKRLFENSGSQWSDPLIPTSQENGKRKLADDIPSSILFAVSNNFDLNSKPSCFTQGSSKSSKSLPGSNTNNNNMAAAKPVPNIFPSSGHSNGFDHRPLYGRNSTSRSSELPGTLTITYSGTVHVYKGVSPEKVFLSLFLSCKHGHTIWWQMLLADGIMKMAGNESFSIAETKPLLEQPKAEDVKRNQQQIHGIRSPFASNTFITEVPLARRATLARFLEKRKNRLRALKPYISVEKSLHCTVPEANNASQCYSFMPEEGTASSGPSYESDQCNVLNEPSAMLIRLTI